MALKDRLKEIRKESGKNQNEMAKNLNISIASYQRYEQGKKFPGGSFLIELAMQGYNLHWVMTGDGDKKSFKTPGIELNLRSIWEWLEDITKEDAGYKEWFRIEFKKRFPEFKEWEKKKNESSD